MISTSIDFGRQLARAGGGLGLTQRGLAMAIGVGERFIVELERGKPTAQLGKALAAGPLSPSAAAVPLVPRIDGISLLRDKHDIAY